MLIAQDMERKIKRIAALHDLSGFGRCALTVIIPALSAMGHQVIPLPTALLSTHTGGFENPYFLDLTDTMEPIIEHWDKLGIDFDEIYSGFLGNEAQAEVVKKLIARKQDLHKIVMVDPVMGDDGVLYSTYTPSLVDAIRDLCRSADIITPNITEAHFLLERPYVDTLTLPRRDAEDLIYDLLLSLTKLGARKIALTGVHLASAGDGENVITAGIDLDVSKRPFFSSQPRINKNYPGTGDLFASVLLGKLLSGVDFQSSCRAASGYIHDVIEYSMGFDTPIRDGIALEACLGTLIKEEE